MIFLDSPTTIQVGDLQTVIKGWYAGETPCGGISARVGAACLTSLDSDRPDVRESYPSLFSRGFRCILDFMRSNFEAGYAATAEGKFLSLEICAQGAEIASFRVPADEDWFEDLSRMKNFGVGMTQQEAALGLRPGDAHYRAYVGLPEHYDLSSSSTFALLTALGLRQHHRLIDIGCGSLRNGRLLIPYLDRGNYIGIDPNGWLIDEGIKNELGADIVNVKRPVFVCSASPSVLDDLPVASFALANSIFTHASLSQIRGWLSHLSGRLSLAGVLVATYTEGSGDYAGDEWVYPGCVGYRRETLAAVAAEYGYRMARLDWRHLHGASWALFARPKFQLEPILNSPLTWNALVERSRFY